jgi:lipopolysaccharide/colanic/teichoic acid biosynthesis glycosyltransferase
MIAETIAPLAVPPRASIAKRYPTIWGLDPIQLHDRFWAARGVCVVRVGEPGDVPLDAELYLLTDARTLAVFRLAPLIETFSWVAPSVMFLRLQSRRDQGYREHVALDENGDFLRYERWYGDVLPHLTRAALTRNSRIAHMWQQHTDARLAWKTVRHEARNQRRETAAVRARVYDRESDQEVAQFATDLVRLWKNPSAIIAGVKSVSHGVWAHSDAVLGHGTQFVGPAWIGAGRNCDLASTVLGPAILWDDPALRPGVDSLRWAELEPVEVLATVRRAAAVPHSRSPIGKRAFDFVFAAIVLVLTAPIYAVVMFAIWLEDGRPFFFAHRRETLGGSEFPCIKFRSMRKDAEAIKATLANANRADGPQFYMPQDPRLTRVGRFIRRTNIDELPQFINVILGHMSVVGPRPSPRRENQFSPAWREARLSVRAGITGLWQVSRTRRAGLDFQEWIKYDLEYVQRASWLLDLRIIVRTISILFKG